MPDADWSKYKQLRGRDLPPEVEFGSCRYSRRQVLKQDFYAAVGLYDRQEKNSAQPAQILFKVYHTDSLWGLPLGWLGRWLARREIRAYHALCGVDGVPQLLAVHGESAMVREFIPGCNLKEFRTQQKPDSDFYPELVAILAEVHHRGMSHNDLAKPENILVREDGRPVLIDFQIALGPKLPSFAPIRWIINRFISYMQGVDRYHLAKHYTFDRPEDFSPEQLRVARKKGLILRLHGVVVRRPYRAVRHFVLRRWMLEESPRKAA